MTRLFKDFEPCCIPSLHKEQPSHGPSSGSAISEAKCLVWPRSALPPFGRKTGVGGDQTLGSCLICTTDCAPYLDAPSGGADSTFTHTVNVSSLPAANIRPEGSTGRTRLPKDLASFCAIPCHVGFVRDVSCSAVCPRSSPSPALVKHHQAPPNSKLANHQVRTCLLEVYLLPRSSSMHQELSELPCEPTYRKTSHINVQMPTEF